MNKNKLKILISAIFCTLAVMPVLAQIGGDAKRVLDACASAIRKSGNIEATFEVENFSGQQSQGSTSGTVCVNGNKYYIDGGNTKIWYDGKTQWSYSAATNEVNVSSPTKAEAAKMNPYSFVYLYEKGYSATMSESTLRGKRCKEVQLTSSTRGSLKHVYLSIDNATHMPMCIRVSSNGKEWTRISVYEIKKNQKFSAGTFRFPSSDFPNAETIDLR